MEKPDSKGIYIEGGNKNIARNNTIIGYNTGVQIKGGSYNTAESNLVISPEAAKIYADSENAILISEIPENKKEIIIQALREMRQSTGKPSFLQKYKDFIATISDHISIIGPVVEKLTTLL